MDNRFAAEQIEKAKTCKTVDELITLAKENGIDLTEVEATNLFAKLNPTGGELADSELETVAGGCGDCSHDWRETGEYHSYYQNNMTVIKVRYTCARCNETKTETKWV